MNTIEQLLSHRSIRKFTTESIDPTLLEKILLAGQSAASSSFVQAYSVIRITDKVLRDELAVLCGQQPYVSSCAEFLVCCADLARNNMLCGDGSEDNDPSHIEQLIVGAVDTSLMAQNMVVAAEASGLGICYIGGIRNNIQEVSEKLQLPDFVFPVFGLCLGYPAQNPEPKPRLPQPIWVMENGYKAASKEDISEYDKTISAYYAKRTLNKKKSTWTDELKGHFTKKVRPHMLNFLQSKGLAKR